VLDLQIQRIRTEHPGETALEPNVIMADLREDNVDSDGGNG
jgi:hypothetical protein